MYAIPFFIWHSSNWQEANKLAGQPILNRQYDNADFIYTWSDLVGLSYASYRDNESLLSKNFTKDTIFVGDPYGKKPLQILQGSLISNEAQKVVNQ